MKAGFDRGTFGLDDFTSLEDTRKRWIRPFLKALGYDLKGAVEIPTDKGLRATNHHHVFASEDGNRRVLVQVEAWGTDLDAARDGPTGRTTPTNQVLRCLTHPDSQARWALLTNGRELRLLGSDLRLPPRAYLGFDLVGIFRDGNADDPAFLLLHGLLRSKALRPTDAGAGAGCLLDAVLEESRALAASVKGALGEVIPRLLENLVRDLRHHNEAFRAEADADEAFRTGVVLLYRLLFIAYAESKGLLPMGNHIYRDSYGLEVIRKLVEARQREGRVWAPERYTLWPQLRALFRFLREDHSTPDLPLMPLGGGLFSSEDTPWLDRVRLPDPAVAHLVDGLSMAEIRRKGRKHAQSRERINYADLDISELGSIYESLLEYKPAIAQEPMAIIETSRGDQTLPERFAGEHPRKKGPHGEPVRIEPGTFYLSTWNGLRKGSGTYYTPRAFTEFQVRNALEPLTRDAVTQGRPEEILDLNVCDPAMGSGAFLVEAVKYLGARLLDACVEGSTPERYEAARDRLIAWVIADHADRAARGAVDQWQGLPVRPRLQSSAWRVLLEVIERARSVTLDDTDRHALERLAAEHCIYGVDVNPMAVQLARVSVWLTTASKDRALTFLDDRLVVGDSLIGARLDDLNPGKVPKPIVDATVKGLRGEKRANAKRALRPNQRSLATVGEIQGSLEALARDREAIQAQPTLTVADAAWKAHRLRGLRQARESLPNRLGRYAHLWAAMWFWEDKSAAKHIGSLSLPDRAQWERIGQRLIGGEVLDPKEEAVLKAAVALGEERHHFCWELAFPEVFLGRGGFDAVVGNPPWEAVRQSEKEWGAMWNPEVGKGMTGRAFDAWRDALFEREPPLQAHYEEFMSRQRALGDYFGESPHYPISSGRDVNTYKFFLQRNLAIARPQGLLAEIVPSGLGSGYDAGPLRIHYLDNTRIRYWIDFENTRKLFPIDGRMRFVLFLAERGDRTDTLHCRFYERELEALRRFPDEGLLTLPRKLLEKLSGEDLAFTEFRSQEDIEPLSAMYEAGPMLGERIEGTWNVKYRREFDTGNDRDLFNTEGVGLPLLKGESFYPFDPGPYEHDYWVEESKGRELLREKLKNSREREFIEASLGGSFEEVLPCDRSRVVFRDVARPGDRRTAIVAVVGKGVFLADTAPQIFLAPDTVQLRHFFVGLASSLCFDFLVRRRTPGHLKKFHLYGLPFPRPSKDQLDDDSDFAHVARCSFRLHQRWASIKPKDPEALHRRSPADVTAVEATLNAYAARIFGTSRKSLEYILLGFPLVDLALKDATISAYSSLEGDPENAAWEAVVMHGTRIGENHGGRPEETMPWQGWSE